MAKSKVMKPEPASICLAFQLDPVAYVQQRIGEQHS